MQIATSNMKSAFKILALLLVILVSSCKKEIQEKQNKIILLTKPSGWLTVKLETKGANGAWNDITSNINIFDADNLLIFDPFNVWAINEGAIKLPGNGQVPIIGEWYFVDKETKIQLSQGGTDGNLLDIIELTETSLQIIVVSNGVTNRYTYKHP